MFSFIGVFLLNETTLLAEESLFELLPLNSLFKVCNLEEIGLFIRESSFFFLLYIKGDLFLESLFILCNKLFFIFGLLNNPLLVTERTGDLDTSEFFEFNNDFAGFIFLELFENFKRLLCNFFSFSFLCICFVRSVIYFVVVEVVFIIES